MDNYRIGLPETKPGVRNRIKTAHKILQRYLANEKKDLLFFLFLILLTLALELCIPVYLEKIINIFVYGNESGNAVSVIAQLFIVFAVLAVSDIRKNKLMATLTEKLGLRIRKDVFDGIVSLPCSSIDKHSPGDLMSRLVNDVDRLSSVIEVIDISLSTAVMILGTTVLMMCRSFNLALVSIATGIAAFIVIKFVSNVVHDKYLEQQVKLGALTADIEEAFRNKGTIDNTNSHEFFYAGIKKQSEDFKNTGKKVVVVSSVLPAFIMILGNLSCVLTIFFGYSSVVNGIINVGVLQAIVMYSKQFMESVNMLGEASVKVQSFFSGAKRILGLLEGKEKGDTDISGKSDVCSDGVAVCFDNVTFGYSPGTTILKNCSLVIPKGKKVALAGYTGSGKSTISNLLLKLYDGYDGEIFLNGINLKDINERDMKSVINISLQDPKIVAGTVYENVIYGTKDISKEEVRRLIDDVGFDNFNELFSEGLDTVISNSSLTLNRKQVVSVLRVLNNNSDIIIFDETLAGFDSEKNIRFKNILIDRYPDKTIIFIGHDLETFSQLDCVYLLCDGQIAEIGTHDELINLGNKYYDLFNNQQAGKDI